MNFATDFAPELLGDAVPLETINGKLAIRLPGDGYLISQFASELGRFLADKGIFNRKGVAFILKDESQQLAKAEDKWLRTWIEEAVVPYRLGQNSTLKIAKSMSKETADAVLNAPQFLECLPKVERLHPCRMPCLREDGTIELLTEGLDIASATYTLSAGFEITATPIGEARAVIDSLLEEFPFAEDGGRSKAVAVAAMLTTFAGAIMPPKSNRPVFIFLGNAEGSGKTTLAQLAGLSYRETPAEAAPRDETEWQKKILTLVLSGRRLILLDNLKGYLNSPSLEAYTTSASFNGRILGGSTEFSGEAGATILITGNGLQWTPDFRRRSLIVELFMREMRAEDRKFRRRLTPATLSKIRPEVLGALLGLVMAWDSAGRPKARITNSSYPEWCDTIGGIVEFAGWQSPLTPAELEGTGDTDTADFSTLAAAMVEGQRYKFTELVELAADLGVFENLTAAIDANGKDAASAKSKLAAIFARFNGRRATPRAVFSVEGKGKTRSYKIKSGMVG